MDVNVTRTSRVVRRDSGTDSAPRKKYKANTDTGFGGEQTRGHENPPNNVQSEVPNIFRKQRFQPKDKQFQLSKVEVNQSFKQNRFFQNNGDSNVFCKVNNFKDEAELVSGKNLERESQQMVQQLQQIMMKKNQGRKPLKGNRMEKRKFLSTSQVDNENCGATLVGWSLSSPNGLGMKKPSYDGISPFTSVSCNRENEKVKSCVLRMLLKEDVLSWLDAWGSKQWYAAEKEVESVLLECPLNQLGKEREFYLNAGGKTPGNNGIEDESAQHAGDKGPDFDLLASVGEYVLNHVENTFYVLLLADSEQKWLLKTSGLLPFVTAAANMRNNFPNSTHADGNRCSTGKKNCRMNGSLSCDNGGGPFKDRVNALVLLSQQMPLCCRNCLEGLKNASSALRVESTMYVNEQEANLWLGKQLLPQHRRLKRIKEQSKHLLSRVCLLVEDMLRPGITRIFKHLRHKPEHNENGLNTFSVFVMSALKMLMFWRFEEVLGSSYISFVNRVRSCIENNISIFSFRSMKLLSKMLSCKREAEQLILQALVQKLGSKNKKLASVCAYELSGVLRRHPPMKGVFAYYVGGAALTALNSLLDETLKYAASTFVSLAKANKTKLSARLKYRRREITSEQQFKHTLSAKHQLKAGVFQRLMREARSSNSRVANSAATKMLEFILPRTFTASLHAVYRTEEASAIHVLEVYMDVLNLIFSFPERAIRAIEKAGGYWVVYKSPTEKGKSSVVNGTSNKKASDDTENVSDDDLEGNIKGEKAFEKMKEGCIIHEGDEAESMQAATRGPSLLALRCMSRLARATAAGVSKALNAISTEKLSRYLPLSDSRDHAPNFANRELECSALTYTPSYTRRSGPVYQRKHDIMGALYTLAHSLPCSSTRILVLKLLHTIVATQCLSSDRLSRVVYEQLQWKHGCLAAENKGMLFSLLQQVLLQQKNSAEQMGIAKRLLQESLSQDNPAVCVCATLLVASLLHHNTNLYDNLRRTEAELQESEEHFHDITDESNGSTENMHDTFVGRAVSCVYDHKKRDPKYSRADETRLWEISAMSASFHPVVSLNSQNIIRIGMKTSVQNCKEISTRDNDELVENIDSQHILRALHSFTNTEAMNLIAYKPRQRTLERDQGESPKQLNSVMYWKHNIYEPDEEFIYKYFTDPYVKELSLKKKCKIESDGADADATEGFSDDEVDEFLEKQMKAKYGDDGDDYDDSCSDGEGTCDDQEDVVHGDNDSGRYVDDSGDNVLEEDNFSADEIDEEEQALDWDTEFEDLYDENEYATGSEADECEGHTCGEGNGAWATLRNAEGVSKKPIKHTYKGKRSKKTKSMCVLESRINKNLIKGTVFADASGLQDLL